MREDHLAQPPAMTISTQRAYRASSPSAMMPGIFSRNSGALADDEPLRLRPTA